MLEKTLEVFDKFQTKLGVHKKKDYEALFNAFLNGNRDYIKEMYTYIKASDDEASAAKELSEVFTSTVVSEYSKRGKLPRGMKLDLSLFMIYYIFPSIIKMGSKEDATILANALRDEWRNSTGNKDFDYTTYDEIYTSFNEKIFGLF